MFPKTMNSMSVKALKQPTVTWAYLKTTTSTLQQTISQFRHSSSSSPSLNKESSSDVSSNCLVHHHITATRCQQTRRQVEWPVYLSEPHRLAPTISSSQVDQCLAPVVSELMVRELVVDIMLQVAVDHLRLWEGISLDRAAESKVHRSNHLEKTHFQS